MAQLADEWNGVDDYPGIGPQCQLTFYVAGNLTIKDIFVGKRFNDILAHYVALLPKAWNRDQTSNAPSRGKLISEKRGPSAQNFLGRLQLAIQKEQDKANKTTFADMMTSDWHTRKTHTVRRTRQLKALGVYLPYNHTPVIYRAKVTDLLKNKNAGGRGFIEVLGDNSLRWLLETPRSALSAEERRLIHVAKMYGVLRPIANPFGDDETPTETPYRIKDRGNTHCCGANGCQSIPGYPELYCEHVSGTTNCNVLSDPCP